MAAKRQHPASPSSSPSSSSSPHKQQQQGGAAPLKVVHIFSPRIFRSDASSFRSLVQCLTGNKRHSPDSSIPVGCIEITPRKKFLLSVRDMSPSWSTNSSPGFSDLSTACSQQQPGSLWATTPGAEADNLFSGPFPEVDILNSLMSSEVPLPDFTMLPPLNASAAPAFTACRYPSVA